MMPIDNNEDTTMWFEVLQRLTKIEANTEGLNEISGIARSALVKSEENAQDIEDMKEAQRDELVKQHGFKYFNYHE